MEAIVPGESPRPNYGHPQDPFSNVDTAALHRQPPDFEMLERRLATAYSALSKVQYPEALRSLYAY